MKVMSKLKKAIIFSVLLGVSTPMCASWTDCFISGGAAAIKTARSHPRIAAVCGFSWALLGSMALASEYFYRREKRHLKERRQRADERERAKALHFMFWDEKREEEPWKSESMSDEPVIFGEPGDPRYSTRKWMIG